MRFSELAKKFTGNPRNLVLVAAGVLALSVLIGLFAGLAGRKTLLRDMRAGIEEAPRPTIVEHVGMLLPAPVLLPDDGDRTFHFFLEEQGPDLDLLPVRVSDLLRNRAVGVEVECKPFIYSGEELDVLSPQHELAEP